MKKMLLAVLFTAALLVFVPTNVKADAALDQAIAFNNMNNNWLNQQWDYYLQYEQPVMNVYDYAMTNQYSQALAARYQSDLMALQSRQRAATNSYQLWANEYAHQQNIATQYANMKNQFNYNQINNWDTSFYNNQDKVVQVYGYMFGQAPFPQVQ